MSKLVIVDNYDSFTYNLAHAFRELGEQVTVVRNDRFELQDIAEFDKIVLSPGPGIPEESGLLLPVIREYAGVKPMFGVCLGEQAMAVAFGGRLINLSDVFHGVQTPVTYLPDCLEVTAVSPEGQVMGLRHRQFNMHAVQFHPESVLTPEGAKLLKNWLNID